MNIWTASLLLILPVIVGGMIVHILSKVRSIEQSKLIKILLAFSGGFLLAIAFYHFLPELYLREIPRIGLFIIAGFMIQMLLELFSGGIEHGHVHLHKDNVLPLVMLLSLSIHSFIEGIPLSINLYDGVIPHAHHEFEAFSTNSYLLGMIFHQIPVAIALMTILKASHFSNLKAWAVMLVFALMIPFGTFVGYFYGDVLGDDFMHFTLAVAIGMFLHISTTIIFESAENHKYNLMKLVSILIGIGLAILINP